MQHKLQTTVQTLIHNSIPVLLEGPSGSGKTTILMNAARNAGMEYSFLSGTRQTTVSHIIGFMNVNGIYTPSPFRKAYTEGHYFNIDEIDAMDSNVLLIFNSLENNIMSFPDGYTEPPHENFRLMATANPQDQHESYVGRNKLDAATLDRFDQVSVSRDENLEKSLVDVATTQAMGYLRGILQDVNSSTTISMRDSMRYHKRKSLGLLDGFVHKLVRGNEMILDKFKDLVSENAPDKLYEECDSFDELVDLMNKHARKYNTVPGGQNANQTFDDYNQTKVSDWNQTP
jgi:MoxR-like ATPase